MASSAHSKYLAKLPIDWEQVPVRALGAVYAGGTPSRDIPTYWNGTIPWVTPAEITRLESKCLSKTNERITAEGLDSSAAKLLPEGSLLVTTRATIGAVAVSKHPVCTNQGFKNIVPDERSNVDFYYHLFSIIAPELSRLASGSTFPEINQRNFEAIIIPRPSKEEQRRIAEILDTIDEAIQKTEALISKLKAMKQGLLHDLLTRGLDKNGKLRDPKVHPGQFKDSPLGRIPEKWELEPLYRLVLSHKAGIFKPMSEYGEGSRIVGVSDLFQHEYISDQPFRLVRLSKAEKDEYFLNRGDLLYAESSLVFDGIAKTLAVTEEGAGTAFAWHTRKLSVNKYRINYKFLTFALDSSPARSFVRTRATQTALTGIPVEAYLETPVPIPDIDEQHRIVKALDMLSSRINTENQYHDKLKLQKKGLMHDLLTGKVRVKVTCR